LGLGATPNLGIPGEDQVIDGLEYIEQSKLNGHNMKDWKECSGHRGGDTAIDCATIAKRCGAENVTMPLSTHRE